MGILLYNDPQGEHSMSKRQKPILQYALFLIIILLHGCMDSKPVDIKPPPPPPIPPFTKEAFYKSVDDYRRQEAIKSQSPWSDHYLWTSFRDTKTGAIFRTKIHKDLPEYQFEIVGSCKDEDHFHPKYINISNVNSGKIINKLYSKAKFAFDGWSAIDSIFASLIQIYDINNDGFLDLRILGLTGATGVNHYATYLYNPRLNKFEYHKKLSSLPGVRFDKDKRLIITYDRCGYCQEYMEYYAFVDNKLNFVKAEWTYMDNIWTEENGRKVKWSACFRFEGIPRNNSVKVDTAKFLCSNDSLQYMRNKMKDIKEADLDGNLDGRDRGPLGTPHD